MVIFVSDDVAEKRLSVCNTCEQFKKLSICGECGCYMVFKVTVKTASCPLGRWE